MSTIGNPRKFRTGKEIANAIFVLSFDELRPISGNEKNFPRKNDIFEFRKRRYHIGIAQKGRDIDTPQRRVCIGHLSWCWIAKQVAQKETPISVVREDLLDSLKWKVNMENNIDKKVWALLLINWCLQSDFHILKLIHNLFDCVWTFQYFNVKVFFIVLLEVRS